MFFNSQVMALMTICVTVENAYTALMYVTIMSIVQMEVTRLDVHVRTLFEI